MFYFLPNELDIILRKAVLNSSKSIVPEPSVSTSMMYFSTASMVGFGPLGLILYNSFKAFRTSSLSNSWFIFVSYRSKATKNRAHKGLETYINEQCSLEVVTMSESESRTRANLPMRSTLSFPINGFNFSKKNFLRSSIQFSFVFKAKTSRSIFLIFL